MKYVVKKSSQKSSPINPIKQSEYSQKIKKFSTNIQKIINSQSSKPQAGEYFTIRDSKGGVGQIIFITEDKPNIWTYAHLAERLPKGIYKIATKLDKKTATNAVIGWELGTYVYDKFKTNPKRYSKLVAPDTADYAEADSIANSVIAARELINTPPYNLGPEEFTAEIKKMAKKFNAKLKTIKDKELLKEGYESIFTVGKASEKRPHLVDLKWGNAKHPKVTLVGKGVTFDTGGLNIKGSRSMRYMKKDMGGAAIVFAAASMIMAAKLPVRLRVLFPLVENAISDEAYRPSDIITTRAGITVEVDNTDAEGRLILCEPLNEADKEKPELLIDAATLTGAARVAVGTEISAYFTNDDGLSKDFEKAASEVTDPIWRLPLWGDYERMLDSDYADCVNSASSGYAGATTAALFLKKFVTNTKSWLHIDTHAWNSRNRPGRAEGGEAMAARAIYQLVRNKFKK